MNDKCFIIDDIQKKSTEDLRLCENIINALEKKYKSMSEAEYNCAWHEVSSIERGIKIILRKIELLRGKNTFIVNTDKECDIDMSHSLYQEALRNLKFLNKINYFI